MEQYIGVGRRKTSIARVFLRSGTGKISINKKHTVESLLRRQELIRDAVRPLHVVNQHDQWDAFIRISGGGIASQADAISLGIARALVQVDEQLRDRLREHDLLTRDSRMVERKKYGQPGARKQFQFSKR